MKKWTAQDIKNLRLQLGWSAADFSRHFGCDSELILKWEKGDATPSPDDELQFHRLTHHLNSYCEQVSRGPAAECELKRRGLAQICSSDILDYNQKI